MTRKQKAGIACMVQWIIGTTHRTVLKVSRGVSFKQLSCDTKGLQFFFFFFGGGGGGLKAER